MDQLLKEWDLDSLIPIFTENEISVDDLSNLNKDIIKELIPKIGVRLKFVSKLQEYNYKLKDMDALPVVIIKDDVHLQSSSASCSEVASETSTASSQILYIPTYNANFSGLENLINQDNNNMIPNFELDSLLLGAPYGSLILKYYKENGILNEYMRNKLVDIIIRNVYTHIMEYNLTHQQYNLITAKIIQCFPSECHATYYLPKKHMGHAVQPKGKLVDKVKNLRYYSPDKTYQRRRKSEPRDDNQKKELRINTYVENNAITWLKFNREPWEDVITYWKQTYNIRREFESQTVSQFISEWPIIGDPRAESLIEADFCNLYPGKELLLLKCWQDFFEKIAILKIKDFKENKDPVLTELLSSLENTETLSEDSKTAIQLLALPRLVPPKGRIKSEKGHWKFSTIESVEALIIHCQNPGDIELEIQNQIEKASKRKVRLGVQPYLLVQGEVTNIKNIYIIIDKIHFKCESTLKGLDLLFKLFFVLKIKYPCQAEHIWMLIQKAIFKITDERDKLIPYVEGILNLFQ